MALIQELGANRLKQYLKEIAVFIINFQIWTKKIIAAYENQGTSLYNIEEIRGRQN
jgi:hypothetical protein